MTLDPSWDAHLRSCHDVTVTFPAHSGLPLVHLKCVAPDGLSRQRILVAVEGAVRPQFPDASVEIEEVEGDPVVSVRAEGVRVRGEIALRD